MIWRQRWRSWLSGVSVIAGPPEERGEVAGEEEYSAARRQWELVNWSQWPAPWPKFVAFQVDLRLRDWEGAL